MSSIFVEPDGTIRALYSDAFASLLGPEIEVERAGHVEFDNTLKGWTVTFPDGSMLRGVFTTREAALKAERIEVLLKLRYGVDARWLSPYR